MFSQISQIKKLLGLQKQEAQKPFSIGYQKSWNKKLIALSNQELLKHVLIVGQSGYGQGTRYFYPTMHKIEDSFIVVDKGDSHHACLSNEFLTKEQKQKRIRLDPSKAQSHKFNWIPFCKHNNYFAHELAKATLFNTNEQAIGFHSGASTDLLAAIYAYTATLDNPTPTTAYSLISNNTSTEIIERLSKSDSKVVSGFLALVTAMDRKVIEKCYLETIKDKLSWLKNEQIASFTDTPDTIDFTLLRKEKVAIHIVISEDSLELHYASQHLARIILTCALMHLMQWTNGKSVYLFIRHLTDLGYFSYLDFLPQLSQYKIGLIACSQNHIDAWLHRYGQWTTKVILDNFHTKIFLEGIDYSKFAKYLPSIHQLPNQTNSSEPGLKAEPFKDHLVLINNQKPFQVTRLR